jgi:uncharacterized protein
MTQTPVDHDRLAALCRRYGIQRLRMFGSAAEGESSGRSDVDLLVEFIPAEAPGAFALVELQDKLSVLFGGKPIDLAFPSILRNPFRRRAIEPQLRPLYG